MRILIADDEIAQSKALRPLFAAGGKRPAKKSAKRKTAAGAADIGRLVVARAPRRVPKGRAGAPQAGNDSLDLGDQPEQTAAILDALGISLLNRGMFDEGAKLIAQALQIRRKFFGNDHPATALSLNSFSRVQRESGDYRNATASVQDALRINRKVFGDRGYPVAASLLELALVQLLQGLFVDAATSAQDGLKILQDLGLYETDPNSTRLMDVIGRAQVALGQLESADASYETLLKLDRKQLGTRIHPKYATHLANYGLVKEARKKRKQAYAMYVNAIDLYENTLNRHNHPNLIDVYANVGSLLRSPPTSAADLKEAGKYLHKALQLGLTVRGDTHPLVGNDYANLGRWQYDIGERSAAIKSFAQALDVYSRNISSGALPPDHVFVAEALTWLGRLAVETDTADGGKKAEPLLRQAVAIWPSQLGPGSLGEALASAFLGRALGLQGLDPADACRLLCDGYQQLKGNPMVSPVIVKQLASWIKLQNCVCEEPVTAK